MFKKYRDCIEQKRLNNKLKNNSYLLLSFSFTARSFRSSITFPNYTLYISLFLDYAYFLPEVCVLNFSCIYIYRNNERYERYNTQQIKIEFDNSNKKVWDMLEKSYFIKNL